MKSKKKKNECFSFIFGDVVRHCRNGKVLEYFFSIFLHHAPMKNVPCSIGHVSSHNRLKFKKSKRSALSFLGSRLFLFHARLFSLPEVFQSDMTSNIVAQVFQQLFLCGEKNQQ